MFSKWLLCVKDSSTIDLCSCERCSSFKAIRSLIAFGQYKHGWPELLKISKVSEWKKTKEPTQVLKILMKS